MAGLIAAFIAAAVLIYAAAFAKPAWEFAQAEPHYAEVAKGKLGSVVELDALTQALRASPWRADLSRAALVQMLTAQQSGLESFRAITRLSAAQRDLRLGLAAAPADVFAWTRLAVSEVRLGNEQKAGAALSMAFKVAPADRKLAAMQFDLAVVLWHYLDKEARAALERRLAWAARWPEFKRTLEGNSVAALRQRLAALRNEP
jgi:hypothetical protein